MIRDHDSASTQACQIGWMQWVLRCPTVLQTLQATRMSQFRTSRMNHDSWSRLSKHAKPKPCMLHRSSRMNHDSWSRLTHAMHARHRSSRMNHDSGSRLTRKNCAHDVCVHMYGYGSYWSHSRSRILVSRRCRYSWWLLLHLLYMYFALRIEFSTLGGSLTLRVVPYLKHQWVQIESFVWVLCLLWSCRVERFRHTKSIWESSTSVAWAYSFDCIISHSRYPEKAPALQKIEASVPISCRAFRRKQKSWTSVSLITILAFMPRCRNSVR